MDMRVRTRYPWVIERVRPSIGAIKVLRVSNLEKWTGQGLNVRPGSVDAIVLHRGLPIDDANC